MTDAYHLAEKIPIIVVLGGGLLDVVLKQGKMPLTTSQKTQESEQLLDLEQSRYFYAGRAHPDFGDMAVAYRAREEESFRGGATPFDTGAVAKGYIHPFKSLDEDMRQSRGRALVSATEVELHTWRNHFEGFLDGLFDAPVDYIKGEPPLEEADWGPEDLPARHRANVEDPDVDWRAWSWEIRFHETHDLPSELGAVACSTSMEAELEERAPRSALPVTSDPVVDLVMAITIVEDDASEAYRRLEDRIKEMI